MMRHRFADENLLRLVEDENYKPKGLDSSTIRAFRKCVQFVRNAKDERDFYAAKGLHYEKLKGKRSHQHSMRLNRQFRLILEIEETDGKRVVIISIEDYH